VRHVAGSFRMPPAAAAGERNGWQEAKDDDLVMVKKRLTRGTWELAAVLVFTELFGDATCVFRPRSGFADAWALN
jgi:hypothetical protein